MVFFIETFPYWMFWKQFEKVEAISTPGCHKVIAPLWGIETLREAHGEKEKIEEGNGKNRRRKEGQDREEEDKRINRGCVYYGYAIIHDIIINNILFINIEFWMLFSLVLVLVQILFLFDHVITKWKIRKEKKHHQTRPCQNKF